MPPLMRQWRKEWASLHPGWTMKLWSEWQGRVTSLTCDGDILNSSFPKLIQKCCHLSQQSNIWRYELIERFGGLYLDTDFEPIKNLEPLIDNKIAFAGLIHSCYPEGTKIEISCGLMGCPPHHPWAQDLTRNIETRDPSITLSLGVTYSHEITSRHPEVHLFEPDVFYSHRYNQPARYKPPVPPTAYAVHRWSSKWFPSGFKPLNRDHSPTSH